MIGRSLKMERLAHGAQIALLALCLSAVSHAQVSPNPAPSSSPGKSSAKSEIAPKQSYHEDWSSPSLDGSTLIAAKPVLGAKDDAQGSSYIRERYQMIWRPDDPLDVFVVRPKGVPKPPVIIYLYSFPQDTDRFKDNNWCTFVTNGGYAAVGFVSANTGHRMEHHAVKDWFVSELQESLGASAHDVQMILNYLETRGDLDMDHVGMFGQGSGGSIAILASAADPRIKALDLLTPWGDWPSWLANSKIVPDDERANYLTPEFLASAEVLEPIQWLPKVKARSVRLGNVRKDTEMSDAAELKMEAAAPAMAEINQFGDPGAMYPEVGRLMDWIKDRLNPDAKPAEAELKTERVHYYPPKGKPGSPVPLPAASGPAPRPAQP